MLRFRRAASASFGWPKAGQRPLCTRPGLASFQLIYLLTTILSKYSKLLSNLFCSPSAIRLTPNDLGISLTLAGVAASPSSAATMGVPTLNYLLVVGLALFSSASGALLVALLHIARSEPSRNPNHPESEYSPGPGSRE
jgi:hypothetical protein